MPGKTTNQDQQVHSADKQHAQAFKFEVSANKLFHININGGIQQVNFDVGAGDYGQKLTIPIPHIVQSATTSVYSYVAPYAEWSYNKVLKKRSSE